MKIFRYSNNKSISKCKAKTNQINYSLKKLIANMLILVLFLGTTFAFPVITFAGAPTVYVDESTYVNLDYYGSIRDMSVVKGVSLNGIMQFTDYGDYKNVTNMSSYDKPSMQTGSVSWNLAKSNDKRFYYNCQLDPSKNPLPWNFDLTYKLNGIPKKAEDLAGAAGLIQIDIKVSPNTKSKAYYQNNMLLQIATIVNMDDTYSLDAPGSQLQAVGSKKTVLFMCLPGEKNTFSIRLGTDSFESDGITMMMVPATLDQFKDIKALKEAKDTVKDSSDAIYVSMDSILTTLASMDSDLKTLKKGTLDLEAGRQIFSNGKSQMNTLGDTALTDLNNVSTQMKVLIPYFQTAKNMTDDLKDQVDAIVDNLKELDAPLSDSGDAITEAQGDLVSLGRMLDTLSSQLGTMLYNLGSVVAGGGADPYQSTEFQGAANMAGTLNHYKTNIDSLISGSVKIGTSLKDIIKISQKLISETDKLNSTLGSYHSDIISLLDDSASLTTLLTKSLDSTSLYLSYTKLLLQSSGDKVDSGAQKSLTAMQELLDKSLKGLGDVKLLKNANSIIKKTIDSQIIKFEKENKFLNIDSEAPLVSFTSDKNPEPASLQIILRTEEISSLRRQPFVIHRRS